MLHIKGEHKRRVVFICMYGVVHVVKCEAICFHCGSLMAAHKEIDPV